MPLNLRFRVFGNIFPLLTSDRCTSTICTNATNSQLFPNQRLSWYIYIYMYSYPYIKLPNSRRLIKGTSKHFRYNYSSKLNGSNESYILLRKVLCTYRIPTFTSVIKQLEFWNCKLSSYICKSQQH